MLLEHFLSRYQVAAKYACTIDARPSVVYRNIFDIDLGRSKIIKMLYLLRGLPASSLSLKGMQGLNFKVLVEKENKEIVIGLIGQFWKVYGNLQKTDSAHFKDFDKKGYAKAAFNFYLEDWHGKTRLSTETRIFCGDNASLRRFKLYWFFVGPFSGWIRREMLRLIKEASESQEKTSRP